MAKRIAVIVSQGQSANPAKRGLEEDIVAALLMEPGVDVAVIPHLYDLKSDSTGVLALRGISSDMIVLSWLFERAATTTDRPSAVPLGPTQWRTILAAGANLEGTPEPTPEQRTDYFALCLAAHFATAATYVPTDVDTKIRRALWQEAIGTPELSRMRELTLGLAIWDMRSVSARIVDVKSFRMRTTSLRSACSRSRISLFVSSISAGSMNTVWPVADSSRINPFSLRLCSARIGSTTRPSRTVGSAPSGTHRSATAWRNN